MADTNITITLTSEIEFDPPDCPPGWYVILWIQIANQPRTGQRSGPFSIEMLEKMRDRMLTEETTRIERNIEDVKRSVTEQIKRAQTTQKGV